MTPPTAALSELSERIQLGDAQAEEELVQTFSPRVFAMALARTRDREASRDLVQDVLWTVVQALRDGQLRQSDKLAAFVCGTARNLISNYRRTQSRTRRDLSLLAGPRSSTRPTSRTMRSSEARAPGYGRISDTDRRVLWLTLVKGLTPGEIATRLRLSPEVVRQRKSRAIKRVMGMVGGAS
jgi:RNA polymerase sigma factor (sigma-70 family)